MSPQQEITMHSFNIFQHVNTYSLSIYLVSLLAGIDFYSSLVVCRLNCISQNIKEHLLDFFNFGQYIR